MVPDGYGSFLSKEAPAKMADNEFQSKSNPRNNSSRNKVAGFLDHKSPRGSFQTKNLKVLSEQIYQDRNRMSWRWF